MCPQPHVGHIGVWRCIKYNRAGCQDIPECHITKRGQEPAHNVQSYSRPYPGDTFEGDGVALLTFLMLVSQISPFPRASKWGRGLTAPPTPDDLRTTYRPNGHQKKYNKEGKTAAAYCMRQAYGTIGKSASLTILTFEEYSHVAPGRTTADTDAFRWHRPYDDCRKRNRNYAIC
jgi:hypothetical protein